MASNLVVSYRSSPSQVTSMMGLMGQRESYESSEAHEPHAVGPVKLGETLSSGTCIDPPHHILAGPLATTMLLSSQE